MRVRGGHNGPCGYNSKTKKCKLDKRLTENDENCEVVNGRCAVKSAKLADSKSDTKSPIPDEALPARRYAKVHMVEVDETRLKVKKIAKINTKYIEPYDPINHNFDETCWAPEWEYISGSKTGKILCKSKKEYKKLMAKHEKDQYAYYDALAAARDAEIIKILQNTEDVRNGDFVEDQSADGYGHRTTGLSIVKKDKKGKISIGDIDEYGTVTVGLSLGPNYPVGYWKYALEESDDRGKAYWPYYENYAEPVHKSIIKKIKQKDLEEWDIDGNQMCDVKYDWGILRFDGDKSAVMKKLKSLNFIKDYAYFIGVDGERNAGFLSPELHGDED